MNSEWKINNFTDIKLKNRYILAIAVVSVSITIFIIILVLSKLRSSKLILIVSIFILSTVIVDIILLVDYFLKKKSTRWFNKFLKDIKEISSKEEDGNYKIKILLERPYEKIKIETGKILIERYVVSTGKSSHVVTKTHVLNKKEFEFENRNEIEFEIEKGKVIGFMEKSKGLIEGPGIILHTSYRNKFIFLFSDDSYIEDIKPEKRSIKIENDTRAYLEFSGYEDNELLFYLSVLKTGKARSIKAEFEWIYKKDKFRSYIKRELIKRVKKPGTYEIRYKFLKGEKNIYVIPSFYIPNMNLMKISKNTGWKVYYKLSLDIPLSPDKYERAELFS